MPQGFPAWFYCTRISLFGTSGTVPRLVFSLLSTYFISTPSIADLSFSRVYVRLPRITNHIPVDRQPPTIMPIPSSICLSLAIYLCLIFCISMDHSLFCDPLSLTSLRPYSSFRSTLRATVNHRRSYASSNLDNTYFLHLFGSSGYGHSPCPTSLARLALTILGTFFHSIFLVPVFQSAPVHVHRAPHLQ